jgi:hypothetical protein
MQTRSIDVRPNPTPRNVPNSVSANIEHWFDLTRKDAVVIHAPNLSNNIGRHLGGGSSLIVNLSCDGIKMIWIDALRNTTQMVQHKPTRDNSSQFLIDPPMSQEQFSMRHNGSIPVSANSAAPNPARRFVSAILYKIAKNRIVMSLEKAYWLTYPMALLVVIPCCYRSRIPASTLTQARGVWKFRKSRQGATVMAGSPSTFSLYRNSTPTRTKARFIFHGPLQSDGSGLTGGTRHLTSVYKADARCCLSSENRIAQCRHD